MSKCLHCDTEIKGMTLYWCDDCGKGVMPECWKAEHNVSRVCDDCIEDLEREENKQRGE